MVWEGRSLQNIDKQITYPLTAQLLGVVGVKTVRCSSMTGLSVLFVLFDEDIDYCSSIRILIEKLSLIPVDVLSDGMKPLLGPDATGLGQLFWYAIEGRDAVNGEVTGGWTLDETRKVQDFFVQQALLSVGGVAEVASAGEYINEYQIEIDPIRLAPYTVTVMDVITSLKNRK